MIKLYCPVRKVVMQGSWIIENPTIQQLRRAISLSGQGFGVNLHPDPNFYPSLGLVAHNGLDIACPRETEILAAHDGKVAYVQNDFKAGYGIVINAPSFKTIYWHQLRNLVQVGQKIKAGDVIGLCDNTGLSTGDHLHFGLKLLDSNGNTLPNPGYDGAVDPTPYLVERDSDMTYRLVKVKDGKDVFRIKDGKRDLFLNGHSFTSLDGRWSAIEEIQQSELDTYPEGEVLVSVANE